MDWQEFSRGNLMVKSILEEKLKTFLEKSGVEDFKTPLHSDFFIDFPSGLKVLIEVKDKPITANLINAIGQLYADSVFYNFNELWLITKNLEPSRYWISFPKLKIKVFEASLNPENSEIDKLNEIDEKKLMQLTERCYVSYPSV